MWKSMLLTICPKPISVVKVIFHQVCSNKRIRLILAYFYTISSPLTYKSLNFDHHIHTIFQDNFLHNLKFDITLLYVSKFVTNSTFFSLMLFFLKQPNMTHALCLTCKRIILSWKSIKQFKHIYVFTIVPSRCQWLPNKVHVPHPSECNQHFGCGHGCRKWAKMSIHSIPSLQMLYLLHTPQSLKRQSRLSPVYYSHTSKLFWTIRWRLIGWIIPFQNLVQIIEKHPVYLGLLAKPNPGQQC